MRGMMTLRGVQARLELTPLGRAYVLHGIMAGPGDVTPEVEAKRAKALAAATAASRAHKAKRRAAGKFRGLPPQTPKERARVAFLELKAKAHEAAARERNGGAKSPPDSAASA